MGVRDERALVHAAHLGIAMQLTNIARDVREDWQRGRLYLPDQWLDACGAPGLRARLGGPLPADAVPALARATQALLRLADRYYASGDAGLLALGTRCSFGVRAARLIYAAIGGVLRARGCDPLAPRAVVPLATKAWLVLRALFATFGTLPRAPRAPRLHVPISRLPWRGALALECGEMSAPPACSHLARIARAAPLLLAVACAATPAHPASNPSPALAPTTPAAPDGTGQVVVDLLGVASAEGQLLIALHRTSETFPDGGKHAYGARVHAARAGSVSVEFDHVPPGPFAISVHHDADGDAEMDTGLFGIPTEGYGFSRDASAPFGPPGFSAAELVLHASERKHVPIHLRY
jgi:uncharacterized protein (DUF2141 family)